MDGNGDYVQIVIQVTGSDFDYSSILDHIRALKRKTEYADTDYLVDETCEWLRSKGNHTEARVKYNELDGESDTISLFIQTSHEAGWSVLKHRLSNRVKF